MEGFVKARYSELYRIPIWYKEETEEIVGRNWFYDLILDIVVWIDVEIIRIESFDILVEE